MFVFWKIWHAFFCWNTCFEIHPFALLPTIYHFLVESKPHERMDLLITASVNIYQTKKKYFNNNENFSARKVMKQSGTPLPFLRESSFQLTPYLWAIFPWPLSLSKFQKQDPPPLILGGRKLWVNGYCKFLKCKFNKSYLGQVKAQLDDGVKIDDRPGRVTVDQT